MNWVRADLDLLWQAYELASPAPIDNKKEYNMNPQTEPTKSRSLDPGVELRTIPGGWDLSGFYTPAEKWVNEPQQDRQNANSWTDPSGTPHDAAEDAV